MLRAGQSSSFLAQGEPARLSKLTVLAGCILTPMAVFSAGQYKRIVSWPGSIDNTSGVVEIDSPFAAALDETSMVEIMPFRGKNIFHNTHYKDVGVYSKPMPVHLPSVLLPFAAV